MLFGSLIENPALFVAVVSALLLAITVHEAAHAWVALRLGDDTAERLGRVTLNPLAHLDVMGTLMLLVVGFGWGKPVPVNPNALRSHWDELLVSLAGPFSNLITAALIALAVRIFPISDALLVFFGMLLFYQIVLMLFNLIPIPPLDGSKLWKPFLSPSVFAQFEQFGPFILITLILFSSQVHLFDVLLSVSQKIFEFLTGRGFFLF